MIRGPADPRRTGRLLLPGLFAVYAALGLALYRPALRGPFLSDDFKDIVDNPYVASLSAQNLAALLDPRGAPALDTANYAPVHLILHALEVAVFGADVAGYHGVNVLVHALAAVLLVALLRASGLGPPLAALGGACFALHPASVEAVAWISQLKSAAALALALGALLACDRRPALGTALFGLALLTKPTASFALPMAAALLWTRYGRAAPRRAWAWLAAWALGLALYAAPEFASFEYKGRFQVAAYQDPWVHLRSVAAIGVRYLVMAASSYGVSAWHEPEPVRDALDPWWLAALPVGLGLGFRLVRCARERREEAAWWIGAAAAFAPVGQLFPFYFAMADRYLYFMLPGLIGGALLLGSDWAGRLRCGPGLRRGGLALAALALAGYFLHGTARARLWRDERALLADAAAHYPTGSSAAYLRACRAAARGDAEAAAAQLRPALERGSGGFRSFQRDPCFAAVREAAAFRALSREIAGRQIEEVRRRATPTQALLRGLAGAHFHRGEYAEAEQALERALRMGGPLDATLLAEYEQVRAARRRAEVGDPPARP